MSPLADNATDFVSIRWSGYLKAPYSESFMFYASANDGARLKINDVLLFDNWVNTEGGYGG